MTIQEAIKSGKPFRRAGLQWGRFWVVEGVHVYAYDDNDIRYVFDVPDILATDWELKP